jgi:hypothetical protein
MTALLLVFIGMMAFLAESCHGDQTQGQQSVLKIMKTTVKVHSVWHINVTAKTDGQMQAAVYNSRHP